MRDVYETLCRTRESRQAPARAAPDSAIECAPCPIREAPPSAAERQAPPTSRVAAGSAVDERPALFAKRRCPLPPARAAPEFAIERAPCADLALVEHPIQNEGTSREARATLPCADIASVGCLPDCGNVPCCAACAVHCCSRLLALGS